MTNLIPSNDHFDSDFELISKEQLSLIPDPICDYEDFKCQFESYVPFYEKLDYIVAASSGMLTAALDLLLVGKTSLKEANTWGTDHVNNFVIKAANKVGYKGNDLQKAVKFLEDRFPFAGDVVMNSFGSGLQHHLRDFSHHPTIVGLFFSLLTQFTGKVYGTNELGVFISVKVPDGMYIGKTIPEKIIFGTVKWMFHMISDMAGSSGSIGKRTSGTGIPGPILSFMKEASTLPFFKLLKDKNGVNEFSKWLSKLFNGTANKDGIRFDLRTELGLIYNQVIHSLPVIANELIVRGYFLVSRLCVEIQNKNIKSVKQLERIDFNKIIPIKQRKLTRMLTISTGTFFAITTSVTVARGIATENYADIFINLNYAGIARFAIAVKEDYKYIGEDIHAIKREAEERQLQRDKWYAEQDLGLSYFTLTGQQARILDSLKERKLDYDISKSRGNSKAIKSEWKSEWLSKITSKTGYDNLIHDEPVLYNTLHDEVRRSNDETWLNLIALELARFEPYFPFGEDVDKDKQYKKAHLISDYENDVFTIMQNYLDRMEYKDLSKNVRRQENILNGTTQKLVSGIATTIVITAISGGVAYFAAPTIAVAIAGGSFTHLSGAALTSASLASIGGGALSAGGLGMSGGTMIITGGGALLSFLSSGSASATTLQFLSSKGNVIKECSGILTYCELILAEKEDGKEIVSRIINYIKSCKSEYESDIDLMKASNSEEADKKLIKAAKANLKYIDMTIKELEKKI